MGRYEYSAPTLQKMITTAVKAADLAAAKDHAATLRHQYPDEYAAMARRVHKATAAGHIVPSMLREVFADA